MWHAGEHNKAEHTAVTTLGAPASDLATYGWRHGLWQWLRLENSIDWMSSELDPITFATGLFGSPLCVALEELRIGIVRWEYQDQPAIVDTASDYPWARSLTRLHVGDVDSHVDMDHHAIGDIAAPISRSFPNLRWLKLHSGSQDWSGHETFGLGGLALPQLRELTIETCAMTSARMAALGEAELPELERLELWFGDRERSATATADDCRPLWNGKRFPKVRHLALRNSMLTDDFIAALAASPLARSLVSLDFALGSAEDDQARALAAAAARFPGLTRICFDRTFVGNAGLAALAAAFPAAQVSANDPKRIYDFDPALRYVSVAE